jgi:nucleoside-diphosphate-sugar epimerase
MANGGCGRLAMESDAAVSSDAIPRAASEEASGSIASAGVNVSVVRLPQVHDTVKQGLVSYAIGIARERGYCAYVGDGHHRWPAAHVTDVARLYRLVIEKAQPGARYHAVAEQGISLRVMSETIGRRLRLPVRSIPPQEADAYFGWLAHFASFDLPASSAQTRTKLGWQPTGPGMIADLERLQLADA